MHGPGAVSDALLCTTDDFFKSTRLFKIRRIGFLQIRSRVTAYSNPADYIPVFTPVQAMHNIKLKVEWKVILLSFELVDIRPRHQCAVGTTGRRGRPDFVFAGPALGLPALSGLGRLRCVEVFESHVHVRRTSNTTGVLARAPTRG